MIELTHGQASEKIVVTLNEKKTLTDPYYLFVFTHTLAGQVVTIIRASGADESLFTERYNQFDVNTSVSFLNKAPGEWLYRSYEQASAINTDPDLATTLVESGKMYLLPAVSFAPTMYDNTPTTFYSYQG